MRWLTLSTLAISLLIWLILKFDLLGVKHKFYTTPPSFIDDAVPADANLTELVKDTVAIIDSSTTTRSTRSYQLHVLVEKETNFVPVGIQLEDIVTGLPEEPISINFQENLYCLRFNPSTNKKEPYARYIQGLSHAYETEIFPVKQTIPNRVIVDLFIETEQGRFIVEGIEIKGKCTWLQE